MSPVIIYDGKILITEGAVSTSIDCCCVCRPDQLKNAILKLIVDPGHCCNCAKYKLYINGEFYTDLDFNNYPVCDPQEAEFNVDLSKGSKIDGQCCIVKIRLDCNSDASDFAFDEGEEFDNCGTFFAPIDENNKACHDNIINVEILLPNEKNILSEIPDSNTDINIDVCPEGGWVCGAGGCENLNDSEGFETIEDCEAVCEENYLCETNNFYCYFDGYSATATSQEVCEQTCYSNSYNCDIFNGCVPALAETGTFATLEDCQATCEQNYLCDENSYYGFYCYWDGTYSTTATNQTACEAICVPESYSCDQYGGCLPLADSSGAFTTLEDCQASCEITYQCYPEYGYQCYSTGYSISAIDYATCQENCNPE